MNPARRRPHPAPILRSLAAALAVAASATAALAVPLLPGGSVNLPGRCVGGTIIRDALIPFTIRDGSGRTLSGMLQDRVLRRPDGTLTFEPRIHSVSGTSALGISRVVRTGYEGFATDVDWCNCCIGFAAPTSASRSGDGENIDFSLSFAPVFRGQDSTFFGAITDARQFDLSGRLTLYLEDGTSATVTVSAPVLDATPPQVRITSPAPESCVCPSTSGQVTIQGVVCDDESDTTYRVRIRRSGGADGTGWTELAPTTTERCSPGTLAIWDATGMPEGEYIVELEATNQVGLVSTAALEFRLNTTVAPASIRTPADGQIIGGSTCLDGSVGGACLANYRVDYRPLGSGTYQPVDPAMPVYTSSVTTDPIASWDTRALTDGQYQVRVRVSDVCGNNADLLHTYEVDNTAPIARIDSLAPCSWIDGLVEIRGEVFDKNINAWVLEYTGADQRTWRTIASGSGNVPAGELLAVWDTTALPRCAYTVRLRATDKSRVGCLGIGSNSAADMVSVNIGCLVDLNGDGVLDIFDFLEFSNRFDAGCP